MAKHKKHEAIESEEIKHKTLLVSDTIQTAEGETYAFTLWADSSEIPRYELVIELTGDNEDDLGCPVDPHSLQKLTSWFARAVLRVSKSAEVKSTQIQDPDGTAYEFALWADDHPRLPRYQLDISVLADPDDCIGFVVDLYGVQKLTAWFAEAALRASKYEADHSQN